MEIGGDVQMAKGHKVFFLEEEAVVEEVGEEGRSFPEFGMNFPVAWFRIRFAETVSIFFVPQTFCVTA